MTPVDSALELADAGYRVFPAHGIDRSGECTCGRRGCMSAGKHPAFSGWQEKATSDRKKVEHMWLGRDCFNPAIATGSGLVVLDVDGQEGLDSLRELEAVHGSLPATRTVRTGSGGYHYYFHTAVNIRNSVRSIGKGLDIRGDGGLVIAPGAVHRSGGRYQWVEGRGIGDIREAEIPPWLLNLMVSEVKQPKEKKGKKEKPEGKKEQPSLNLDADIPEGQRNESLNRIAFILRKQQGKTMKEIDVFLHRLNQEKCKPPLSDKEVDLIIRSVDELSREGGAEDDFRNNHPTGLVCAADVEDAETQFLVKPYLPVGKLTLIQGNPGEGKTAFSCYLAARVSTGTDMLGVPCGQGNVLILSVEDDQPELKKRIAANGGDLSKCFFVAEASMLSFISPEVEAYIKQAEAKLVIFDPFQSFLGSKVDMHRANETRPVLAQLADVADRTGCAIALICHMAKGLQDTPAVLRSLGSTDIPGASRSIMQIGRADDNPNQRLMVHVKCSNAANGKSLLFSIGEKAKISNISFTEKDESNFYTFGKKTRDAANDEFMYEEIRNALREIVKESPQGRYVLYSELGFTAPKGVQMKRLLLTLKARLEEDGIAIGDFKRKSECMSVWVGPYIDDFLL